jgi:ABC-type transport system involved in cytochrome bd biosynthesis fused ATPase/permease subunit
MRKLRRKAEQQLTDARTKAENNPRDTRFAWNLARVTLEQYFSRNLAQVNLVFWVAVFVMSVGFVLIIVAIILSVKSCPSPKLKQPPRRGSFIHGEPSFRPAVFPR